MQRYLQQLLSDLKAAAVNPPAPTWIEIPSHMEALPDAITWCWDDPVQYLPSTGYDLQL